MMTKRRLCTELTALVLCLAVLGTIGCGKKGEIRNRLLVSEGQKPAAGAGAETAEEREAKERVLQRQRELREQTLREQAMGKGAGRTGAEAVDKAGKGGAAQEAAILKELQIPDIPFEYDRYSLTPEAQEILKSHAPAFVKYKEYRLVIEGHCDERGTVEYNLALGEERAAQAAKYLVNLGVERERIKTISYGKEKPLDPGHGEAAWAKNRRAHFVVFPPILK